MSNLEKWQTEIVAWNHVHGIKPDVKRQRFFVDCEVKEFQDATGIEKFYEAGDYAFVIIYYSYLLKKQNEDKTFHSGVIECLNHVRQMGAEKFVDAVIASNWTKYVQAKHTNMDKMSQEAVIVAEKYKGRYKQVVPIRSGDYYFIRGLEQDDQGEWHEKVLKPSTFKEAIHFIK